MSIEYFINAGDVDWAAMKDAVRADDFDNGRTAAQLERSFRNSHSFVVANSGRQIVGTARVLSDGVCNAYLVDVWTQTAFRRRGIASEMIRRLLEPLRGQHVYLQTDDGLDLYRKLGFREQPHGMS